jgi:DNA-binding beta-propeller fold protein YncE
MACNRESTHFVSSAGDLNSDGIGDLIIGADAPRGRYGNKPRGCAAGVHLALLALLSLAPYCTQAQSASFVAFESGQVRPLAMSPDGTRLFATNTPDNYLEILRITDGGLRHEYSVPVGLEPVAVAAKSNEEVWVVNHLSDSVSVVRLTAGGVPRVAKTLLVGDEPRDIVFAGPGKQTAFITTAHRGQSSPVDYRPFETQGRADVWAINLSNTTHPVDIITLFGDTPRPLATNAAGTRVYAGIFNSGNQTTVLSQYVIDGDMPPPLENVEGIPAPAVGQIVKFNGVDWVDAAGRSWSDKVRLSLPDWDVFTIDAMANPPVEIARASGVGTTLLNIVANRVSGALYVSNLEARNNVRFEGPGELSQGETVRGHFVENRITVISGSGRVEPRHLNKHIDYTSFPGTPSENARSLATPMDMALSRDGSTLYVAAFGSAKVGIFDTAELEDDTFVPNPANHIQLSGGGPSGLALDEARGRLYVLTRFTNSIVTVDLDSRTEIGAVAMHNPEPPSVVDGRRFLYDARYTSSRGDSSCAGCHIFGDVDHLAWDLGNPDGVVMPNPNPLVPTDPPRVDFHPMKGPLTTQTIRGIATHGPMHWRGDRTGGNDPDSGDPMDEVAAFKAFNVAFEGLQGRTAPLTEAEMQAFTDFALQITPPPNPIRALDNTLDESQTHGADIYFHRVADRGVVCNDCHTLDRAQGWFGTQGLTGGEGAGQPMKVPQLRSLYTKVGFVGRAAMVPMAPVGDQIRGFGYLFDGSFDTLPNFLGTFTSVFPDGDVGDQERLDVAGFLLAYESNLAPIVGQQVTLVASNFERDVDRLYLLRQRMIAGECDLVGKGVIDRLQRGMWLLDSTHFQSDRAAEVLTLTQVLNLVQAPGEGLTFTCVPPGSGRRIGIDRDEDGAFDRDELDAGTDPTDPTDFVP